ncbi:MAG: UDP-3-O-(3-hydroxymyristoyl)glucosamine N-acyltransferase [Candidatus Melainabacteria bacterium]|nr:UDP-3-O-(3-hydroxymyristoyl)glucosamine N-acyltransferase [Candidatus Melainabacteria bacterium]
MKLPKELSLGEIALLVGGRVEGPPHIRVSRLSTSPLLACDGDLTIAFDPKVLREISHCRASGIVVPEGVKTSLPTIVVERPLLALQKMLSTIAPKRYLPEPGIHPTAIVHPTCDVSPDVGIGPLVVVGPKTKIGRGTRIMSGCIIGGEVAIGEDCLFHPGCLIADYVQIGNRVILQQGASLGADGFGYVTERPSNMELRMAGIQELSDEPNPLIKIPQIGTVVIEDDVEVGSHATIDRSTMGATVIGAGSKIDNLVMIAHNSKIGKEAIIVSMTGIAGSVTIGDRAILAGHVGVKDHINIGKDAIIEGKAGVMKDVADGEVVVGSPAMPAREYFTQIAHIRKSPKIYSELKALQKKVAELEALLANHQLAR